MCWMEAAAVAAAVVGGGLKYKSQQAIAKKEDTNTEAEMLRQQQIQQEADARVAQETQRFARPAQDQQRGAIATTLQQGLERAYAPPAGGVGGAVDVTKPTLQDSTTTEVKGEIARKIADALAGGKLEAGRLANMTSFGKLAGENDLALGRAEGDIGQLQNFSARSSAILPYEQQAAQRTKGRNYAMGSDIANLISHALALGSMAGAGAGAAGATSAGTTASANTAMATTFPMLAGTNPANTFGSSITDLFKRSLMNRSPLMMGGG